LKFHRKKFVRKDNLVTETKVVKTKKSSFIWKTSFFKKNGKRPTSHRSTTYLCYVPILEDFAGAGRVGLAGANIQSFYFFARI